VICATRSSLIAAAVAGVSVDSAATDAGVDTTVVVEAALFDPHAASAAVPASKTAVARLLCRVIIVVSSTFCGAAVVRRRPRAALRVLIFDRS